MWGKNIIGLMVDTKSDKKPNVLAENVVGQKINHIGRYGKYIIFNLNSGYLISHLRMTGQWFFADVGMPSPNAEKHFRWGLTLKDDEGVFVGYLWFKDTRKFGTFDWVGSLNDYEPFSRLGVDGLRLNEQKCIYKIFSTAQNTKKPIKNFLLDQSIIAGCGNIYASDALFEARISPFAQSNSLSKSQIKRLCLCLYDIFNRSIDLGGSSISDYAGGRFHETLKVYGRQNEQCYECSGKIKRVVQAGRSTFFCPSCQSVEEKDYV